MNPNVEANNNVFKICDHVNDLNDNIIAQIHPMIVHPKNKLINKTDVLFDVL